MNINPNYIRQQKDILKALKKGNAQALKEYTSIIKSNNKRIEKITRELTALIKLAKLN